MHHGLHHMSEQVFQYQHRVSYAQTTIGDHVYYSRYLEIIEDCRGEFFRHLGISLRSLQEEHGMQFPVRECRVRYRSAARHDDELTVSTKVARLDKVRFTLAYEIHRANDLLITAEIEHACLGESGKALRIPPEVSDVLSPWLSRE